MKHKYIFFITCLLNLSFVAYADSRPNLAGNWSGFASTDSEQTGFILHITNKSEVSVTLSDIGVSKWPGQDIQLASHSVAFDLPSDSGKQRIQLTLKNNQLEGTWKDHPVMKPSKLILKRLETDTQMKEERLIIQGPDGNIGVSYILPIADQNGEVIDYPAVILTHGSGPTTRDVARFAAESFARLGVAAIIYDKRGTGESEGDFYNITFEQLADDAITIAKYFKKHKGWNQIGFWGHSQGGWIAPLASSRWSGSKFTIMSAGPLVTPAREGDWTFVNAVRDFPEAGTLVQKLVASWHDGIRDADFSIFLEMKDKYEDEPWFDASGVGSLRTTYTDSYFKSYKLYMDYDPMQTFGRLIKPVLSIYALQDESINATESIAIAENMIKQGKNIQLVKYDGYGHSMRKLDKLGEVLRFPNFPEDYFSKQARFIKNNMK